MLSRMELSDFLKGLALKKEEHSMEKLKEKVESMMGQYYQAVCLDRQEKVESSGGLKLMEHSYLRNTTLLRVCELLSPGQPWHQTRLVWAGDYMDNGLFLPEEVYVSEDDPTKVLDNLYTIADQQYPDLGFRGTFENEAAYYAMDWSEREALEMSYWERLRLLEPQFIYLINHSKQEFVDLRRIRVKAYGHRIHPLSLLTASGNGRGGGDFWGLPQHQQYVGRWAGDVISVENADYDCYAFTEIIPAFKEESDLSHALGSSPTEQTLRHAQYEPIEERQNTLLELVETFQLTAEQVPTLANVLTREQAQVIVEEEAKAYQALVQELEALKQRFEALRKESLGRIHLSADYDYTSALDYFPAATHFFKEGRLLTALPSNQFLEQLRTEMETALKPIIEEEKNVYCVATGTLISRELLNQDIPEGTVAPYHICPTCEQAVLTDYVVSDVDGTAKCPTCAAQELEFCLFSEKGRRLKETFTLRMNDAEQHQAFLALLEKKNAYAHAIHDLTETDDRGKAVPFKKQLETVGWRFDEAGVIQSLSRYQYIL